MSNDVAPITELGPACAALDSRELAFASALVNQVPPGPNAVEAAAVIAAYTFSDRKKLVDFSERLARDPRIVAAVEELSRQKLTYDVPLALDVLRANMQARSKDAVKSAQILLDRVLPTKVEARVSIEQKDTTQMTLDFLQHLLDIGTAQETLINEFGPSGLPHYMKLLTMRNAEKAKLIESVEFGSPKRQSGFGVPNWPDDLDPKSDQLEGTIEPAETKFSNDCVATSTPSEADKRISDLPIELEPLGSDDLEDNSVSEVERDELEDIL